MAGEALFLQAALYFFVSCELLLNSAFSYIAHSRVYIIVTFGFVEVTVGSPVLLRRGRLEQLCAGFNSRERQSGITKLGNWTYLRKLVSSF